MPKPKTASVDLAPELRTLLERSGARLSEFGVPEAHALELACELVGAGLRYAVERINE